MAAEEAKHNCGECKYKGVMWDTQSGEWVATICLANAETIKLGFHKSADAAAKFRDCSLILLFGRDSVTNFPAHMFGVEELEKVGQSLCFHNNAGVRKQARLELQKLLECNKTDTKSILGDERSPKLCSARKDYPLEMEQGKENKSGRIFPVTNFKPNGCNFRRWSKSQQRSRRKNEMKAVAAGSCPPRRSFNQPIQNGPADICKDGEKRICSKSTKHGPIESRCNTWGIRKPSRKARSRTCRRVPPPIPAAPLGSTKWQYRGISLNQALGLWTAYLYDPENKKTVYLGTRKSQQEAAALHDWGMQILQGQDAVTNFPKSSSQPSFHELKQVKDRLVAAKSVTEDVATARMSQLLPGNTDKHLKRSGSWYPSCIPEDCLKKTVQNGGILSMSSSRKLTNGSKDNPKSLKLFDYHGPSYCKSTEKPFLSRLEGTSPGVLKTYIDRIRSPQTCKEVGRLPQLGPPVAIGVNVVETGPYVGQYLITIGTDRKDTVIPVGYASTAMQAAQVYDMVILALYGHHAILNFSASSYQLRTLGSVIAALPHLFTPHMFWKGMATAEAAGVKNDLSFSGMHSMFPWSVYEADMDSSDFLVSYAQSQRYNPLDSEIVQYENQNHMRKMEQVADLKPNMPPKALQNGVLDRVLKGPSNPNFTRYFGDNTNEFGSTGHVGKISNLRVGEVIGMAENHLKDPKVCDLAINPRTKHPLTREDFGGHSSKPTRELNEEDIHAARTLTLLGSVRKNTMEGESDASDARNFLGSGRTCFLGVCKLHKDIFMATIKYNGCLLEIGRFEDLVHAAEAHDLVALGLMGSSAWTNFPPSTFTSKNIGEALLRIHERYPQLGEGALRNNLLNSKPQKIVETDCTLACPRDEDPGEITRTGRIVRKPKRFQHGFSKISLWDGSSCELFSSLGYHKAEEKDQRCTAFCIK